MKIAKIIATTEDNLVYAKRKLDQILRMKEHRISEKVFRDEIDYNNSLLEMLNFGPCALCMYNPPSSMDGKPCVMCPAQRINMED